MMNKTTTKMETQTSFLPNDQLWNVYISISHQASLRAIRSTVNNLKRPAPTQICRVS